MCVCVCVCDLVEATADVDRAVLDHHIHELRNRCAEVLISKLNRKRKFQSDGVKCPLNAFLSTRCALREEERNTKKERKTMAPRKNLGVEENLWAKKSLITNIECEGLL